MIPFARGRMVFEAAPSRAKTFVALSGADHSEAYARRPDYWPAIDRFLDASFGIDTGRARDRSRP